MSPVIPPGFEAQEEGCSLVISESRMGKNSESCRHCMATGITYPYHPYCSFHAPCRVGRQWMHEVCPSYQVVIQEITSEVADKAIIFNNLKSYLRKLQKNNRDSWMYKTPLYTYLKELAMGVDYSSDASSLAGSV